MGYFRAKSDLRFMESFRSAVIRLWEIEKTVAENLDRGYRDKREYQTVLQAEASSLEGYQEIRGQVAKGIGRAHRVALQHRVPNIFTSYPAPAVGGPVIEQRVFSAILKDLSHGGQLDNQTIYDAINQTIGECEAEVVREKRKLYNPFYWILELIIFIIRIPFLIVQASGFDVGKVEDHLLGKMFKLAELAFIVYVLVRLGIEKESLQQVLMRFLK